MARLEQDPQEQHFQLTRPPLAQGRPSRFRKQDRNIFSKASLALRTAAQHQGSDGQDNAGQ